MNADPSRLEEVWLLALAVPPADRARAVAEACVDDDALRRRVEELLNGARAADIEKLFDEPPRSLGRYELRELIGVGGMGEVYKAWDANLDRRVAVKSLPMQRQVERTAAERFSRETAALARVTHPNVVRLYDAGFDDGRPYLVMERLHGRTLGELVRQHGPRPAAEALAMIAAAASGLAAVHAAGFVHRDVKPDNLFLTDDGVVKVLDLGVTGSLTAPDALTAEGLAVGTADYVAPEQLAGDAGPQADVYALGGTLHFLLTGQPPFAHRASQTARLAAHRTEPPPAVPGVPAGAAALVRRMMAKDPRNRPPGMAAVATLASTCAKEMPISSLWVVVSAFLLIAAGAAAYLAWSSPMPATPDETRQICLAVAAVAGVFGAVFAALRRLSSHRGLTLAVGTAVSVGLIAAGFAVWRGRETVRPLPPRFTTPAEVWKAAADHLAAVPEPDRRRVRVVSLVPVANRPGVTAEVLDGYRTALADWAAVAVDGKGGGGLELTPINDARTLFAVRLSDGGLDAPGWDRLLKAYPYGLRADAHPDPAVSGPAGKVCEATGAEIPVVRGDWLLTVSDRPGEWRADYSRPVGMAELAAELGLADAGPLAAWVQRNPSAAARMRLDALPRGGTVPRSGLGERIGGESVFQRLSVELRLGKSVNVSVD